MANRLKMAEAQSIIALARMGWSYRRIAAEVGVDRDTVSRHVRAARGDPDPPDANAANSIAGSAPTEGESPGANAANSITGSKPPRPVGQRSRCEPQRDIILAKLQLGLTAQRIWQDLRDEHGFADSYQSVQRFVKHLRAGTPLPFRRMECAPGEEAQVDFGRGAPVIRGGGPDGKRKCPHLFRIVLSCSRKAYSEVVARQTTEEFLRCLENAFRHFGGVPKTLVPDNLKAAVIRADWYDPELNPKIVAFCEHYGTVCLPTRPRTPRHKGKVERGVGYAQSNALRGRTFTSLAEQNRFLAEWEASVADTRIHGTTRRQVGPFFAEVEKPALGPLPAERFPFFHEAQRTVNRDGHVEVAKAYYSVPAEFLGHTVWVRWDGRVVRIFDQRLTQIALHPQHEPGCFATDDRYIVEEKRGGIERGTAWWLHRADTVGTHAGRWAEAVVTQRGVHAVRAVMGLVGLTRQHRDADVDRACRIAHGHGAWRLRDVRTLLKRHDPGPPEQERFEFTQEHPLIRSLSDYGRLVHDAFKEIHA
jgi:transposase